MGSSLAVNEGTDADTIDFVGALAAKGYTINPTLQQMYTSATMQESFKSEIQSWGGTQTYYRIVAPTTTGYFTSKEPSRAAMNAADSGWKDSMNDYNVMIVTIARAAGENRSYMPGKAGVDPSQNLNQTDPLGLSDDERALIDAAVKAKKANGGKVIVLLNNASAMEAVAGLEHPIFTFGLDHAADCTAANLTEVDGRPVFDVMIRGEKYARVELHVYGHHNVLNALAAASAAWALGLPGHAVETGLASFTGAGRRFEHKGTYHGAEVYDDYAHHPDELHALFTTAKEMGYERLVVAFQPHTYSRTAKLFERFVEELKIPDVAILAEIFAAREQNTLGISSADLCRNIPGAVYCSTLDKAAAALRQAARPGDLILTVGAGDIYRAGEKLLAGV